jgi:hypothetical protein
MRGGRAFFFPRLYLSMVDGDPDDVTEPCAERTDRLTRRVARTSSGTSGTRATVLVSQGSPTPSSIGHPRRNV